MISIDRINKSVAALGFVPSDFRGEGEEDEWSFYLGITQDRIPHTVGTGFCVKEDYVVTSALVLNKMEEMTSRISSSRNFMTAMRFSYRNGELDINRGKYVNHFVLDLVDYFPYPIDIGLIKVSGLDAPPAQLDESIPHIGEEVGILGFPFGHLISSKGSAYTICFSPSFQKGCISNLLFDRHNKTLMSFQIDHFMTVGMSGSPVFRLDTGRVCGLLWGGPQLKDEHGNRLNASPFGWCIPSWLINQFVQIAEEIICRGKGGASVSITGGKEGITLELMSDETQPESEDV